MFARRVGENAGPASPDAGVAWGMKQAELARELAREERLPPAVAQDRVDELVHQIIKNLRRGRPVELPGLGKLVARAGARKRQ